jgi:hypothetical protein
MSNTQRSIFDEPCTVCAKRGPDYKGQPCPVCREVGDGPWVLIGRDPLANEGGVLIHERCQYENGAQGSVGATA